MTETWTQKTSGGTAKNGHSEVAINGDIYIYGGVNSSDVYINQLWKYNPTTDIWTQLTSGATARFGHTASVVNGKMYVFGGYNSSGYLNDIWEYSPSTDTWTQKTSGSIARYGHTAVVINSKIYVFGGTYGSYSYKNDVWEYNPSSDLWIQKTSGATNRTEHTAVAISNKMYVFGGFTSSYDNANDAYEYNPSTDSWTQKTSGATARQKHTAVAIDNKMYVFGGTGSGGRTNTIYEYNPTTNAWTQRTSGASARDSHSVAAIDNKMYVYSGDGSSSLNTLWEYYIYDESGGIVATQTIQEIKTFLQGIKPDAATISDAVLIQLINEVDGYIFCNILKQQSTQNISLVQNQSEYTLSTGVNFDHVDQVYLYDNPLFKIDQGFKDTTGFYKGSTNNKIKIYPVPTASDAVGVTNLTITYLNQFTRYTALTDYVLVNAPHDKMYYEYISAKINLFNENMSSYNDMVTLYNASMLDYKAWYEERYTNRKVDLNVTANTSAVTNSKR